MKTFTKHFYQQALKRGIKKREIYFAIKNWKKYLFTYKNTVQTVIYDEYTNIFIPCDKDTCITIFRINKKKFENKLKTKLICEFS